jgi:gamma-glutamylcyclotransferase (GGCT)/AIG2-like uncharacterized protein YtfP
MSETAPEYRLVDLGPYPALCEGGGTAVLGEVYAVDDATLAALDALEGHPNWYRRTRVTLADERAAELFLYLDAAKGRTIADGDWRWHRVGDAIRGRCHGNINVDGRSRHSGTSTQT